MQVKSSATNGHGCQKKIKNSKDKDFPSFWHAIIKQDACMAYTFGGSLSSDVDHAWEL
jgi:hypothetical protein